MVITYLKRNLYTTDTTVEIFTASKVYFKDDYVYIVYSTGYTKEIQRDNILSITD